jgi:hypothetical protein
MKLRSLAALALSAVMMMGAEDPGCSGKPGNEPAPQADPVPAEARPTVFENPPNRDWTRPDPEFSNPIPINPPKTKDDRQPLVIMQALIDPARVTLVVWLKNGRETKYAWDQSTISIAQRASPGDVFALRIEDVEQWKGPEDKRATLCQIVIDGQRADEDVSHRGDFCQVRAVVP